jgi:hypothetical protein
MSQNTPKTRLVVIISISIKTLHQYIHSRYYIQSSIYLSVCLSIYLSICLSVYLSIYLYIYIHTQKLYQFLDYINKNGCSYTFWRLLDSI